MSEVVHLLENLGEFAGGLLANKEAQRQQLQEDVSRQKDGDGAVLMGAILPAATQSPYWGDGYTQPTSDSGGGGSGTGGISGGGVDSQCRDSPGASPQVPLYASDGGPDTWLHDSGGMLPTVSE